MQETDLGGRVLGPFQQMWDSVLDYLPSLIAGILILALGTIICWLVKRVVTRIVILMRLDRVLQDISWARSLNRADVRHVVAGTVGTIMAGIVCLVFLESAFVVWKLEVLAQLIGRLVFYLPNIIIGATVLIVGSIVASTAAGRVRLALASEGFGQAGLAARLVHWALMLVIVALTLEEMNIGARTVQTALKIGIGSLGLTVVLAVGLGSREAVRRMWRLLLDTGAREDRPGE